jgi:DNA-binding NarL/FixJ family response regulator
MPRKNGFACLTEIKGNKNLRHLPVVIYSTSIDEHVADLLYQNGAHFYVRKPADFSQMKMLIQVVLAHTATKNSARPSREKFILGNIISIPF